MQRPRLLRGTTLALGAACLATLLSGCGGSSGDGPVNVKRLEFELKTDIALQKLSEGYDYGAVGVRCDPDGGDGLHFKCQVYAVDKQRRVNSWSEGVDCGPNGHVGPHRCSSLSGYALQ